MEVQLTQDLAHLLPRQRAKAGELAVVFVEMHMAELFSCAAHRFGKIVLLNVGMERIDEQQQIGAADLVDEFQALRNIIDEEGFIAVENFEMQGDSQRLSGFADLLHGSNGVAPSPLLIVIDRPVGGPCTD